MMKQWWHLEFAGGYFSDRISNTAHYAWDSMIRSMVMGIDFLVNVLIIR